MLLASEFPKFYIIAFLFETAFNINITEINIWRKVNVIVYRYKYMFSYITDRHPKLNIKNDNWNINSFTFYCQIMKIVHFESSMYLGKGTFLETFMQKYFNK